MKHFATFVLGVALLVALVVVAALWHGPIALVVFALAWTIDRDVARGLGKPRTWLVVVLVLVGLGAWLGPKTDTLGAVHYSKVGALAGITMAARAIGLLIATTSITRAIPPERLLARLRGTAGEPLAASVVVALRLAPGLAASLRTWMADAKSARPSPAHIPRRAFDVLVRGVEHAAVLADEVAMELTAPEER